MAAPRIAVTRFAGTTWINGTRANPRPKLNAKITAEAAGVRPVVTLMSPLTSSPVRTDEAPVPAPVSKVIEVAIYLNLGAKYHLSAVSGGNATEADVIFQLPATISAGLMKGFANPRFEAASFAGMSSMRTGALPNASLNVTVATSADAAGVAPVVIDSVPPLSKPVALPTAPVPAPVSSVTEGAVGTGIAIVIAAFAISTANLNRYLLNIEAQMLAVR